MNIVTIYIGESYPKYYYDHIRQIRKYFDGKLWLIGPKEVPEFEVDWIDQSILKRNSFSMDLYKLNSFSRYGNPSYNPVGFWEATTQRIFALQQLIIEENLEDIIYIEGDNLLYTNPEKIINELRDLYYNSVAINPVNTNHSSLSFVYIYNACSFNFFAEKIIGLYKKDLEDFEKLSGIKFMSDMTTSSVVQNQYPEKVKNLPLTPEGTYSIGFKDIGYLFDSATFGQYIGGVPSNPVPGFTDPTHYASEFIKNTQYSVAWENSRPFLYDSTKNKYFPLANLHIHSKQLNRYF